MNDSFCLFSSFCLLLAGPITAPAEDMNTRMMKATFKVQNDKSTATAFFLSRPAPNDSRQVQFMLVTAAHVLEAMSGEEATLFWRSQDAEGGYKKVPVQIPIRKAGKKLWTKHPTLDVAVMEVKPPDPADIPSLPLDLLAADDTLKRYEIHPGDAVACLGYPHRVEAHEAGFAVLRSGAIASFPLTPTLKNKTFLVSFNSFEGDSGGPVYLAETSRMFGNKKQPAEVRLILGLVVGQHFLDEEAQMIYGTAKQRHRLGLAIVVHAAFIKETIDLLKRTP